MGSLILNRDELSAVVEVVTEARENGLNGPLTTALSKLRAQLAVRFGDSPATPIFTIARLGQEPSGENEIVVGDVHEVHVNACIDGRFQCAKVEVNFYGYGGEKACSVPVASMAIDGETLVPRVLLEAGLPVPVERVLALFCPEILANFSDRLISVKWNAGWDSEAVINLANPDPNLILRLETR
jgi:hypothetical protein